MKKNLISILILALLIVNIVLTSIMMFSVTGTAEKTSALVGDIASVLSLEIDGVSTQEETVAVSMENTEVYDIADQLTIPLTKGADGKVHYCLVSVSLSMNIEDEGYKTFGAEIATKESIIKGEIVNIISSYTMEEAEADPAALRAEILQKIQTMFESKFIYDVTFREILFQ